MKPRHRKINTPFETPVPLTVVSHFDLSYKRFDMGKAPPLERVEAKIVNEYELFRGFSQRMEGCGSGFFGERW